MLNKKIKSRKSIFWCRNTYQPATCTRSVVNEERVLQIVTAHQTAIKEGILKSTFWTIIYYHLLHLYHLQFEEVVATMNGSFKKNKLFTDKAMLRLMELLSEFTYINMKAYFRCFKMKKIWTF